MVYLFRTSRTGFLGILDRLVGAEQPSPRFSDKVWRRRHGWLLAFLWIHPVAIMGYAYLWGYGLDHGALEASPVLFAAILASVPWRTRTELAGWVTVGLFASTVVLVHLAEGHLLAHAHFL